MMTIYLIGAVLTFIRFRAWPNRQPLWDVLYALIWPLYWLGMLMFQVLYWLGLRL